MKPVGGTKKFDLYIGFMWLIVAAVIATAAAVVTPYTASIILQDVSASYRLETSIIEWEEYPGKPVTPGAGKGVERLYPGHMNQFDPGTNALNRAEAINYYLPDGTYVRLEKPTRVRLERTGACLFRMSFFQARHLEAGGNSISKKRKSYSEPLVVKRFTATNSPLSDTSEVGFDLVAPNCSDTTSDADLSADFSHEIVLSRPVQVVAGSLYGRVGDPTHANPDAPNGKPVQTLIRNSGIHDGSVGFYQTSYLFDARRQELKRETLDQGDVLRLDFSPEVDPSIWGTVTLQPGASLMRVDLRSVRATATLVDNDSSIHGRRQLVGPSAWDALSAQPLAQLLWLLLSTLALYFSFLRMK